MICTNNNLSEKISDLVCFSSIDLSKPCITKNQATAQIVLHKTNGDKTKFNLRIKYEQDIKKDCIPLLKMAFFIPLLNYSLFSKQFRLNFPLSQTDYTLVTELNRIFSMDILVNKIIKNQTKHFLKDYHHLKKKKLNNYCTIQKALIKPSKITPDEIIAENMDQYSFGVLSSGGKESLVTYCMIKEMGYTVYPLYVNESGGHWRTAISAYNLHKKTEGNTTRIWTNIDRFYNFMLDNLKFIRQDHRKITDEAYPIRVCIFPFYVFSLLPIFVKNKIGNLLMGSEFDDLDNNSLYCGIPHYYGVYDQHQDYDIAMNTWYNKRIPGLVQWSALRNITGLIVEKILLQRYPEYAKYQRSCHSCHIEKKMIFQCGKCSKCLNILLFLFANKADPKIMNFKEQDIIQFSKRINPHNLKLDCDEKKQSFKITNSQTDYPKFIPLQHIEKFHINPDTCNPDYMPRHIRDKLIDIIEKYTNGYCELRNGKWVDTSEEKKDLE